jgi:hypothetical protein
MQNKTRITGIAKVSWGRAAVLTLMLIVLCFASAVFTNQSAQAFHTKCRFTGGGNFICGQDETTKVNINMDLHCNVLTRVTRLEVTWDDPITGVSHRLEDKNFKSGSCVTDPTVAMNTPDAPCNTGDFIGSGELDGNKAFFILSLQDGGEPGNNDKAAIVITSNGSIVLACTNLSGQFNGNIQAHK